MQTLSASDYVPPPPLINNRGNSAIPHAVRASKFRLNNTIREAFANLLNLCVVQLPRSGWKVAGGMLHVLSMRYPLQVAHVVLCPYSAFVVYVRTRRINRNERLRYKTMHERSSAVQGNGVIADGAKVKLEQAIGKRALHSLIAPDAPKIRNGKLVLKPNHGSPLFVRQGHSDPICANRVSLAPTLATALLTSGGESAAARRIGTKLRKRLHRLAVATKFLIANNYLSSAHWFPTFAAVVTKANNERVEGFDGFSFPALRARLGLFYDFVGHSVSSLTGNGLARPVHSFKRVFGPSCILPLKGHCLAAF